MCGALQPTCADSQSLSAETVVVFVKGEIEELRRRLPTDADRGQVERHALQGIVQGMRCLSSCCCGWLWLHGLVGSGWRWMRAEVWPQGGCPRCSCSKTPKLPGAVRGSGPIQRRGKAEHQDEAAVALQAQT